MGVALTRVSSRVYGHMTPVVFVHPACCTMSTQAATEVCDLWLNHLAHWSTAHFQPTWFLLLLFTSTLLTSMDLVTHLWLVACKPVNTALWNDRKCKCIQQRRKGDKVLHSFYFFKIQTRCTRSRVLISRVLIADLSSVLTATFDNSAIHRQGSQAGWLAAHFASCCWHLLGSTGSTMAEVSTKAAVPVSTPHRAWITCRIFTCAYFRHVIHVAVVPDKLCCLTAAACDFFKEGLTCWSCYKRNGKNGKFSKLFIKHCGCLDLSEPILSL